MLSFCSTDDPHAHQFFDPGPGESLIHLTKGYVTLVNDVDLPLLRGRSWRAQLNEHGVYAVSECREDGKRVKLYMQRVITTAPKGTVVDHWDGRTLNNRRLNLKVVGFNDNAQKAWAKIRPGKVAFRGVHLHGKKFRARLSFMGDDIHLGMFDTAEEAARAYDAKIKELYGPYGWTNFENPCLLPAPPVHEEIPF